MGSRQAILLRKLRESTLPDTPYMSPLRASDEILRQFPTTYLIVSRRVFHEFIIVIVVPFRFFCKTNRTFSGMSSRSIFG